jgi:hypothetical protein
VTTEVRGIWLQVVGWAEANAGLCWVLVGDWLGQVVADNSQGGGWPPMGDTANMNDFLLYQKKKKKKGILEKHFFIIAFMGKMEELFLTFFLFFYFFYFLFLREITMLHFRGILCNCGSTKL